MSIASTQLQGDRQIPAPAYVRLKGAAAFLGCSSQYILKLHRMGMGPRRIKKGRASFYAVADLVAFMEQGQAA